MSSVIYAFKEYNVFIYIYKTSMSSIFYILQDFNVHYFTFYKTSMSSCFLVPLGFRQLPSRITRSFKWNLCPYLYFPLISNKRQEGQLSYPNFVWDYHSLMFWFLLVELCCSTPVTAQDKRSFNVLIKNAKDTKNEGQKGLFIEFPEP